MLPPGGFHIKQTPGWKAFALCWCTHRHAAAHTRPPHAQLFVQKQKLQQQPVNTTPSQQAQHGLQKRRTNTVAKCELTGVGKCVAEHGTAIHLHTAARRTGVWLLWIRRIGGEKRLRADEEVSAGVRAKDSTARGKDAGWPRLGGRWEVLMQTTRGKEPRQQYPADGRPAELKTHSDQLLIFCKSVSSFMPFLAQIQKTYVVF